ncbi:RICIN domain-containing protein [Streptomyces sp. NPDC058000]|uniref:RICIN domain-containing protein n=1 Tax=Streptomyces sp. NPDC058000 TaxID=3346299 RepID=UPI0036F09508
MHGFIVDLAWSAGQVTSFTLHNIAPASATTTVASAAWSRQVTLPPGQSATFDRFVLVNRGSGKAIDDPAASGAAGTGLIQYSPDGGSNQSWTLQPAGPGVFTLVNGASGLAMDVFGGSTSDGTAIVQWTPTGATNQQWTLKDVGDGYVNLVSARSQKLVGVVGSSTAELAGLEQETSTGAANQQWQLILA